MNREQLFGQIRKKGTVLCVGLDTDFDKMPEHIKAQSLKGEVAAMGQLFKGKARSIYCRCDSPILRGIQA